MAFKIITFIILSQIIKNTTADQSSLLHEALGFNSVKNGLNLDQSKYEAPDDCKYTILNNLDVSLVCNLRTVNSEFDTTNFSVIPSENTVSLTVLCNDEIMTKSSLDPKSFIHLARLKELTLEFCKFGKLSQEVLFGLNDLRNLSIRTHNINWPALSLEIESNTFQNTKNLERLDLSQNNIWSLPENLFCSLNGLIFLNVSENRLQDINDLGFREKIQKETEIRNFEPKCLLDLESLDVSYNHFVLLPPNGFGTLKRLRNLKIHSNEISMLADKALGGLKNLQIIDLSSNKIVALSSELFKDPANSIQEIYLQNNSISVLSPGLFANLEQLQALDLSTNQLTSTWIDRKTFSGLIRLVLLNLSNNKITKLESEIFSDLYTLQILNLRYNQLEIISADTFSPMNNLHTLLLSHNKIKYLDAYSLNGLYVLSLLSMDNNVLTGIHPEAFRNCSSLQDLNLNGNELKTVPLALKDMRLLRTVDLGENLITVLEQPGFRGMNNLYGLRLIGNQLENITKNSFKDLPSLQILNLARNKIKKIETGAFETTGSIQAIRLDGNVVENIEGLFSNMQNLLWLNISDNKLNYFDFSQIPYGLQWLDLHRNDLIELENISGLDNQLRLQTLDASFNKIQKVTANSVPNSIELLFLNDNLITSVDPHTFMHKSNLTRVDLYANQITSLDMKALRLYPISEERQLPEFYIGGNPFICDCNIEWLQKINELNNRQYPRVMDLETIYCKLLYNRDRTYIPLIEAESSHFLCHYKTHCFALCQCCEFDACDCEMTCPNNCTCFHDQSWSTNVVECSSAGYLEMPSNIPMDTTEVYIDGNNLSELSGHSFIGRKNLRVLYANNSNIEHIYNTTFIGLKKLVILHLENNKIIKLNGDELQSMENLKELYLQNNRISYIENRTFLELKKLEVLRIDGNKLTHFEVWQLTLNPYLVEIGLAENLWSCECNYLGKLRNYLQTNNEKIIDSNRIACVYNNLTSILKEKNGTKCTLKEGISSIVRSKEIEDLLPLLLAASCAFIGFFGLIFGMFCYRRELRVWAHQHCFPSICYKSANFVEEFDKDRLYDAYLINSIQDEHFVSQILSTTLENDIGYRLCLHYRDFNINTYVTDTIIEAAESSKRTILILSKNFLYNEWSRFEVKSAVHEVIKRQRKIIFVLYGDLPQRDIDADMRMYLRTNTCIEWDDKKFWQKLRMAMPNLRMKNNCLAKRSGVNIYATANDYNSTTNSVSAHPTLRRDYQQQLQQQQQQSQQPPRCLDLNNYATINSTCGGRNCDNNYDSVNFNKYTGGGERRSVVKNSQHDYAVPTQILIGNNKINSENYSTRSETTSPSTQSPCSSHNGIFGDTGRGSASGNNFNSFNNRNSNSLNINLNCAGDNNAGGNINKSDNKNCTLGDNNCIDSRRLPQAMWA